MKDKFQLHISELETVNAQPILNDLEQKQIIGGSGFEELADFNPGGEFHDAAIEAVELGYPEVAIGAAGNHLDGDLFFIHITNIQNDEVTITSARNF